MLLRPQCLKIVCAGRRLVFFFARQDARAVQLCVPSVTTWTQENPRVRLVQVASSAGTRPSTNTNTNTSAGATQRDQATAAAAAAAPPPHLLVQGWKQYVNLPRPSCVSSPLWRWRRMPRGCFACWVAAPRLGCTTTNSRARARARRPRQEASPPAVQSVGAL